MQPIVNALLCATAAIALPAQTFTTLHSFDGTDGSEPVAGFVQGADGNLYGTTEIGGANNTGTIFKITPSGTLTTLYGFGTCFPCVYGANPTAGLVQASNGDFYGTTSQGGTNGDDGTIFKITAGGTLTTLYNFCSQTGCIDGENPVAGLVQAATNGDFFGTTQTGGAGHNGTVFKITPSGTLTTLYSFCFQGEQTCTDGYFPVAGLVQATNGDFYGTNDSGGVGRGGTIFKITANGPLTTLYSFCSKSACADGWNPIAGLVQATDGDFYGTTTRGGANNGGTVFKITPSGALTTIYSFCSQSTPDQCADGAYPEAGLIQATNGDFYGTTWGGGSNGNYGTVFSLSVGLGPFVKALPHSGTVGEVIRILGTDLTGTASVNFNGTPAAFTVVIPTEITATVPAGATTGKIQVTTPGGALFSSGPFLVLQ